MLLALVREGGDVEQRRVPERWLRIHCDLPVPTRISPLRFTRVVRLNIALCKGMNIVLAGQIQVIISGDFGVAFSTKPCQIFQPHTSTRIVTAHTASTVNYWTDKEVCFTYTTTRFGTSWGNHAGLASISLRNEDVMT